MGRDPSADPDRKSAAGSGGREVRRLHEKAVQEKKGEYKNGALRFTDKMLRYAKLYSESAKDILGREENPSKYGLVSKYNMLDSIID